MSHYRVVEANGDYINIGRMGDNLATMVEFDVSDITELYGSEGEFTLSVQRANEYATSASTSAQNASASATSASQAKADAEQAKADAESAKTSAEESASLAQQYADSVDMATVAETIQYLGIGG